MKQLKRFRAFACLLLFAGVAALVSPARAQQGIPLLSGQDVVPVFEGWAPNPDGSFEMYFGYLNRNFEENLVVPLGAANNFSPGEADRGQPSFFYPRRQMFLFHVRVPKDWGEKDLVWTLTSHGKTEKAYGHLLPVWIIDNRLITANVHGSSMLDVVDLDQPPVVKVAQAAYSITLPENLTLTATITDDGIPKPGERRGGGRGRGESTFMNAPLPTDARWPPGLNMTWMVYRGPGPVAFSPKGYQAVVAGKDNVTTAEFSEPGTYVLQATASDSVLETRQNVTVTVKPGAKR